MLAIIKYKIILFTITVTSLTICALIVCLGFLDLYADIRENLIRNSTFVYVNRKVVALSIFSFSNMSIFLHICYMALHALRGFRKNWVMGCHYFLYIVSEMISACVIFTEFYSLNYATGLAVLVGLLAVCLFFITLAAENIFAEIEDMLYVAAEANMYEKLFEKLPDGSERRISQCVTISLRGSNNGATTSWFKETSV